MGSVTGVVNDLRGAAVAGATVTLRHNETGAMHTATTNEKGEYRLLRVESSNYTVTVEASDFKKAVAPDCIDELGVTTRTAIADEVGAVSEVVTVTAGHAVNRTVSVNGLRGSSANITENAFNAMGNIMENGVNAMDNLVKTGSPFALSALSLNPTGGSSVTRGTTSSDAGRVVAQARAPTRGGSNDFHGEV